MSQGPYSVNTRFTPIPWGWYPPPALRAASGYQAHGPGEGWIQDFPLWGVPTLIGGGANL